MMPEVKRKFLKCRFLVNKEMIKTGMNSLAPSLLFVSDPAVSSFYKLVLGLLYTIIAYSTFTRAYPSFKYY
jgi:hypothetical protein